MTDDNPFDKPGDSPELSDKVIRFGADGSVSRETMPAQMHLEYIVQKMTRKIEREPHDMEWYEERGKALMALGRYDEAIPDLSQLIGVYQRWGDYHRLRGLCYYHLGDHAHALEDLRQYKALWFPDKLDPNAIKILEALEGSA